MNCLLADKIKLRSSNINVLRFVSALAVVLCHSYALTIDTEDFVAKFNNGQCNLGGVAVAVFFFLSGLYVTKSLEKENSYVTFLKKRCKRILPQLWVVVLASVLIGALISKMSVASYYTDKDTWLYLLNGLMIPIHNLPGVFAENPYQTVNGPLWTLPVEVACYLGLVIVAIFGKILFPGSNEKRRYLDIVAFGVLFLGFLYLQIYDPRGMLMSVVRAMVIFFEGVLYYDYRERIQLNPIVGFAAFVIMVILAKTPLFNFGLVFLFPYVFVAIALGLPQFRWDLKLFSISYEMYLVGWPIQQVLVELFGTMTPLQNFLLTVPIDVLIGFLLYLFTEWICKRFATRFGVVV